MIRIILLLIFLIPMPCFSADIPKIIHTCVVDEAAVSRATLDNWKKFAPDYTIKIWNDKNFNPSNTVQKMYADKKDAKNALSDYCAVKVLNEQGGLYLSPAHRLNTRIEADDTDVPSISFARNGLLFPSFMAMPVGHPVLKKILSRLESENPTVLGRVPLDYLLTEAVFETYPILQRSGKRQQVMREIRLIPANIYILNLGDADNRAEYDFTDPHAAKHGSSVEDLKKIFLREQAFVFLRDGREIHLYPVSGEGYYAYEIQTTHPFGYVDEYVAAIDWDKRTTLFVKNENDVYESKGTYRLGNKTQYGESAKAIAYQGNKPPEDKGKK